MKVQLVLVLATALVAGCVGVAVESPDVNLPCVFCEAMLNVVHNNLPANYQEWQLLQLMVEGCNDLPKALQPECKIAAALIEDDVYGVLTEKIPPQQACATIKICSKVGNTQEPTAVAKPAADVPCVICEFVLTQIAADLPANFTEAELEDILKGVCSKLPKTITPECNLVVALYGEKIFNAINGDTPPDQVCTNIDLCHNSTVPKAPKVTAVAKPPADVPCVICEFALYLINLTLPTNYTEQQLDKSLKAVCDDIPKTLAPECNIVMGLYEDKIYEAITGEVPRHQVCTNIKACKSALNIDTSAARTQATAPHQ